MGVKRSTNQLFQEVEVEPGVEVAKVEEVLVVPPYISRVDEAENH